jgi:hypothetical protein
LFQLLEKILGTADKMSNLIHKTDGGFMKKHGNGIKCQHCGYFLKQKEITSAYLHGKIQLPFLSGPSKMTM